MPKNLPGNAAEIPCGATKCQIGRFSKTFCWTQLQSPAIAADKTCFVSAAKKAATSAATSDISILSRTSCRMPLAPQAVVDGIKMSDSAADVTASLAADTTDVWAADTTDVFCLQPRLPPVATTTNGCDQ